MIRNGNAITRETERKIIESYKSGLNIDEVADKMHLCYKTVWKYLKRNGVERRDRRIHSYAEIDGMADDYLSGLTYKEVAIKYGTSENIAQNIIKTVGAKKWNDRRGYPTKVIKYDTNGNELCRYQTITEASIDNNVGVKYIRECCKGIRSQTKGYSYKYAESLPEE